MKTTREKVDNHLLITLDGRLDTIQSDSFEKEIGEVLAENHLEIVIDCSGLSYISSSGLRILLTIQKRMMSSKGRLTLCSLQPAIREVFDMSGFSTIFTIVEECG